MWKIFCSILSLVLFCAAQAEAHFGMVIPSAAMITEKKDANLKIDLAFAHPMEMKGMDMAAPKAFTVTVDGRTEDVRYLLNPSVILGHKAWQATYAIKKPGVYQFVVAQAPYFEPAEDRYIVHYTKTVTAAFGGEEGWNEPLGLKTEIVPLTRPFGNYAGNIFCGQVLLNGKPAPNTDVEVEFWNTDGRRTAPNEYFLTQIVRTDQNGVFAFGVPWAGWWGFAALSTADEKLDYKGEQKPVELGAVLWTEFVAPRTK